MTDAARAIWRAKPLGHYPFATKLAGVLKHNIAVALVMLIEHNAPKESNRASTLPQQLRQLGDIGRNQGASDLNVTLGPSRF